MKRSEIKPCNECPFSKNSTRGFLADYTPERLHRLVMTGIHFPCHKTLPMVDSIPIEEASKYPVCKGSLLYMRKGCKLHENEETQKLLQSFTKEELDQVLSIPEFLDHHTIVKK